MSKVNRSWMAVVAAAVLLGTLVGAVWARPNHSSTAAATTRKVTLVAADFIPSTDDWDYANYGDAVFCEASPGAFVAPVVFPSLAAVTVERIKLHVDDGSTGGISTATLYRGNPSQGPGIQWAAVSSPTGTSGGLQTYTSGAINKVVWPSQRAYVHLSIPAGGDVLVYGVTVEYHVNT